MTAGLPATMPTGNAVPPAVVALHEAWRTALPQPDADDGVQVYLGREDNRPWSPRVLTVAVSFDEDIEAFSVERTEQGARPNVTEEITVACSAYVGGEDVDVPAWREQMGRILDVVDEVLRADPGLRNKVARARRGYTRWLDWIDEGEQAVGVILDFVVIVTVLS